MFISTDFLVQQYGVDETIARFFVDRDPPKQNLYWHEKLLYLRPSPGYLFIPLIVDLLYKCGISREQLLSTDYINTMEQTGHISALEETGQVPHSDAVSLCIEMVKDNYKNERWYNQVVAYFNGQPGMFSQQATPFKALHRGDLFLFSICRLAFPAERCQTIVSQWFALISTLLLLDDSDDLEEDKQTGDENALIECGMDAKGFAAIRQMVTDNLQTIAALNGTMSSKLAGLYHSHVEKRIAQLQK